MNAWYAARVGAAVPSPPYARTPMRRHADIVQAAAARAATALAAVVESNVVKADLHAASGGIT
eukprot:CAMPEP_0206133082 /NCGR_PEP_ID=MMETSP1472-20131121/51945_1 /ASSEMBLY_ACC=CAM_ASM_001108 /TAXON_ID=41880 /ORGANISM="Pycnococcus provasolii, Strain RCC251" /LENGTH=62 /DNA_ID=CAMNT_0053524621 /DNA_START=411 /DNA_END=595 /DNA_ORIENTATION=-